MSEKFYKVLNLDGSARIGTGCWPLPTDNKPGKWISIKGKIIPCQNGLHLCRREDLIYWLGPAIYLAEYQGIRIGENNKIVVRKARLISKFETWNRKNINLFAQDCVKQAKRYAAAAADVANAVAYAYAAANRAANATADAADAANRAAYAAANAATNRAANAAAADAADAANAAADATAYAAATNRAANANAAAAANDTAYAAYAAYAAAAYAAANRATNAAANRAANAAANAAADAANHERERQTTKLFEILEGNN